RLSVRHSGRAAIAASAGIHNHGLWVWIPGSRALPAARNDASESKRGACVMSAMSRRTREQDELAEQLAAILREANERLRLWGRCSDTNCQRERICCGDADQCGTRVAPESWAWLRHVVQEMLAGASQDTAVEAANRARLGYRARRTVRWQVPCWDPIEFFELHDGTWVRADQM